LTERALQPAAAGGQADPLRAELRAAQEALRAAEAELAAEQAAVNAFRMHARLMLDDLADAILLLRARKQALLTELALAAADDDPLGPPLDAATDAPPAAPCSRPAPPSSSERPRCAPSPGPSS